MLATFLIMLREGLEAALIIAIIAIFLAKMNRQDLFKYLYIGIALAAVILLGARHGRYKPATRPRAY